MSIRYQVLLATCGEAAANAYIEEAARQMAIDEAESRRNSRAQLESELVQDSLATGTLNVALTVNKSGIANDEPPGKMPRTAIGKLAIKAAWQIERKTGQRALRDEVITMLQSWIEQEYALLEIIKGGVSWQTTGCKVNNFDIEACGKALERWHKSRT